MIQLLGDLPLLLMRNLVDLLLLLTQLLQLPTELLQSSCSGCLHLSKHAGVQTRQCQCDMHMQDSMKEVLYSTATMISGPVEMCKEMQSCL